MACLAWLAFAAFAVGAAAVPLDTLEKRQSCSAQYAQCGGLTWTGPTTCCTPYVCVYSNDYYSQCLAGSTSSTTSSVPRSSSTTTTTVRSSTTTTTVRSSTTTTTVRSSTTTTTSSSSASPRTSSASSTTSRSSSTTTTTTTTFSPTPSPVAGKLAYYGVNEAGAEFGDLTIPGVLGTDYTWPLASSIQFFWNAGMNVFRIPFLWERAQASLNGSLVESYLSGLDSTISTINSLGGIAIIEPHNFARYPAEPHSGTNNVLGSAAVPASALVDFWVKLGNRYKSNSQVWLNIMNEPNNIDTTLWVNTAQATVNALRAAGINNKLIIPGNYWTGAWAWYNTGALGSVSNAQAFVGFKDPANNFFIEAHQYLDSDGSGTSSTCVSTSVGVERLTQFTLWARTNGFKTFLGEIGGSNNDVCAAAIDNALSYMEANNDVWQGVTYWAAGPWWPTSDVNEIEPKSECGKLPCKTLIWAVLQKRLTPVASTTTTTTASPVPKPTTGIVVYTDTAINTASSFSDGSWSSTVNYADKTVYNGTTSVSATISASTYGAFSLIYNGAFSSQQYQYWHFLFASSSSSTSVGSINVGVKDAAGTADSFPLSYWLAGATVSGNTFTEVYVDISMYAVSANNITQFWLQDSGAGVSFNLDNISFEPYKTSSIP